jgi:hypothetical protein
MTKRKKQTLAEALEVIRNPDGKGLTRVSAGWGDDLQCLRCKLPVQKKDESSVGKCRCLQVSP